VELPDAIDSARPSVVQLGFLIVRPQGDLAQRLGGKQIHTQVLGTGFFVDEEGHVVTAKHVLDAGRRLDAAINAERKGMMIGVAQKNSENMRANFASCGGTVIAEDEKHDLALIKLAANPFTGELGSGIQIGDEMVPLLHEATVVDRNRPRDGESVATSGYPLSNPVLVTSSGAIASSWAFAVQEIPVPGAPKGFTAPDLADRYLVDMEVNGGNSGGPVYRVDDATVVGVCVATQNAPVMADDEPAEVGGKSLSYSSGLTVVIPASVLAQFLDENSIGYRASGTA
jgi:S1-C subfamily serine protease